MSDTYWDEIRARSEITLPCGMKLHCGDCSMSYFYGANAEGKPLPCPKHATPEERARADRMMASDEFNAALRSHPLLTRRSR